MARKRDVVVGVIIGVTFLFCLIFFGLAFLGALVSDDGVALGGFGDKVAVVEVYGTIESSRNIIRQLKKYGDAGSVKAILLHIDSPGGAAAPSQEIYNEIKRVRDEDGKIVVASFLTVAASGGYMIACGADKIVSNPSSITGSIGVIMQYPTLGGLFEKVGIDYQTVKSGELKDVGSLHRPLTDNEREMLGAMITDTYEQFIDIIVEGRRMDRDQVYKMSDGSIFSGRQAYRMGLVDTLGGYEEALLIAADMAGIDGEPNVIKEYRQQKSIWDVMGSLLGRIDDVSAGKESGPRIMYLY
jgi:protease-4